MSFYRSFFIFSLALSGLLSYCARSNAQTNIRVREDIDIVARDPAKLSALKLAFTTLSNSGDTQNNLRFWANIHGAVPPEVSTGPCIHKEEAIWAWHRSYLWQFENALRNSHPPETNNVTLPYWNWVVPPSGKRYPLAYEDPMSSLYWANRITTPYNQSPVPADSETSLLDINNWLVFGGVPDSQSPGKGQMESTVHDAVHGFVGKDMSSTSTSARDPIFWSHHANLDRIWLEWSQKWHQDPSEPLLPLPGVPGTQGDWVDVSQKYSYGPPAASQLIVQGNRAPAAEALQAVLTIGQPLKLTPASERIQLVITNIQYPKGAGPFVNARIYLVPVTGGSPSRDSSFARSHYLGYFIDWLSSHNQHVARGAGGKHSITLDVTARARGIVAATGDAQLGLSFELTNQTADGKLTPLMFGVGGVTFDARLEIVTLEQGKVRLLQKLETKPSK